MSSDAVPMKTGWYLLKAKPREEIRALDNLEYQGFEAYCPQIRSKTDLVPLFPGYLFIRLAQKDIPQLHKIRSTRGVQYIVRFNRTSHKLYAEGRLTRNEMGSLLPNPIPNGDQIIEQIEAFTWHHNGCIPDEKPASVDFCAGEAVSYDNPLFRHLESTFVKGINMDRGIILIHYIESMRTESGIEKQVVAQKSIEVPLKDLRKVSEER